MPATPAPASSLREFTLKAVLAGLVFGVLFGAANAYLGLKAGLTVSTSIPIAVLSAMFFRALGQRQGTILEANLAQTIGSASSSLASGSIFTIPALFMWGVAPTVVQVAMLAFLGGLLGILAMVPLRRLLIVQADKELPYPEGRACALVLRATESGAGGGRWIVIGIVVGVVIKIALGAAHLLPEEIAAPLGFLPNASLSIKIAPALLAVGYIVGFRASSIMVGGSLISALVLVPLVTKAHSIGASGVLLSPKAVKDGFLTYIGAGAVAAAALVTIARTAPTMVKSLKAVWSGLRKGSGGAEAERTDRDLPAPVLLGGIALLVVALATIPDLFAGDLPLRGRIFAAIGVAIFGFLFVPVSSRLVGLIGVSSNPVSAMALLTLAGTSAVFFLLGWRDLEARAAVLTVGTVVCVAASKAGDISQDLKTGWLVGGTPKLQQVGQLIAAAVACWAVALVVVAIGNGPEGFVGEHAMPAPQAHLMRTMVEAVLGAELPWDMLGIGGALSLVGTLAGLPALPFALGIYLPLSTMAAIFAGGVVRHMVDRGATTAREGSDPGILCASGFVAGEGLAGVALAAWAMYTGQGRYTHPPITVVEGVLALLVLVAAGGVLYRSARTAK